uniref:non-specific serine/threonine protein kinase n=1 Tax=Equus asinus asinus TaxID=83772 RepID=A0A8C4MY94_EQUAS
LRPRGGEPGGAAGGAGRRDGYPGQARRGPCTGWAHSPPVLTANLTGHEEKVSVDNFELLKVLGTGAYGKVFLVRKAGGHDAGKLYAMKVLRKAALVQRAKTQEHTRTERSVLELVRQAPFLVTLHYAFQTDAKLHLILDYVNGGEMFTHLYQRQHFKEAEVRVYGGEIVLALEHLHKVGGDLAAWLRPEGLGLGPQTWQPQVSLSLGLRGWGAGLGEDRSCFLDLLEGRWGPLPCGSP